MRKQRWLYGLVYPMALATAAILLGREMLHDAAAHPQGDPPLTITLVLMSLGMCLMTYGLYFERHKILGYAMHRVAVHKRSARRRLGFKAQTGRWKHVCAHPAESLSTSDFVPRRVSAGF